MTPDDAERQEVRLPDVQITICAICGRDNRVLPLRPNHYTQGKLCRGKLRNVEYVPVESMAERLRAAREEGVIAELKQLGQWVRRADFNRDDAIDEIARAIENRAHALAASGKDDK